MEARRGRRRSICGTDSEGGSLRSRCGTRFARGTRGLAARRTRSLRSLVRAAAVRPRLPTAHEHLRNAGRTARAPTRCEAPSPTSAEGASPTRARPSTSSGRPEALEGRSARVLLSLSAQRIRRRHRACAPCWNRAREKDDGQQQGGNPHEGQRIVRRDFVK